MKRIKIEELLDSNKASALIATYLQHGELALLLGAGISFDYGLPSWLELVQQCEMLSGCPLVSNPSVSSQDLQRRMDQVRRQCEQKGDDFYEIVTKALYAHRLILSQVHGSPLMQSLGVMMIGGDRGSIQDVITANFDSLIEMHMRLHGYSAQSITALPTLLRKSDVRIYHPNGYLPEVATLGVRSAPGSLILDSLSFDRRLADPNSSWNALLRQMLSSKVGLAIGLSTEELFIRSGIANVSEVLDESDRPVAFWFFSTQNMTNSQVRDQQDFLMDRGCVPVMLNTYGDLPAYLLKICEQAAKVARMPFTI